MRSMCRQRQSIVLKPGTADRQEYNRNLNYQRRGRNPPLLMPSQLQLLDLPVEILSEILCQLDHIHILRCSVVWAFYFSKNSDPTLTPLRSCNKVCKQLHVLINTSLALQYRIELASDGLVNGQPGGSASTTAARMEILLERRAAWRALRPNRRTSVAFAGHCHAYELVGGLFAKALEDFGIARRFVASWLPGNGRGESRFVVDDLGVRIKDFALDPSQDLLVLLEHRPAPGSSSMAGADICVHLRKLSAVVTPHPAAKSPMLCRRAIGPVHGCMIQIVEDIVGMYFWMPFHAMLIWNWMSGEELLVRPKYLSNSYSFSRYFPLHSLYKTIKLQNAFGTFHSSLHGHT